MGNRKLFLLYPFSILYGLITGIRNLLYDLNILHSQKFTIPVICVGNITVGGTGKTPHTEYLVNLLKSEFRVAVLSRGYKRKSKGFIIADEASSVMDIGDEPLQISRKFPGIIVAVDNDRRNGIKKIMKEFPETDVIILDDGFQHRRVKPGFSILLTDYSRLITRDILMPAGRLRESSKNRKRADILIVTKTDPAISDKELAVIRNELQTSADQKVFFTKIDYGDPVPVFNEENAGRNLFSMDDPGEKAAILITGIASPAGIMKYLDQFFSEIIHLGFADHHYFKSRDLDRINAAWQKMGTSQKILITTEKDAVRLREFTNIAPEIKRAFYYLPVEVRFLKENKNVFDSMIFDYVGKNKRNS